MEIIGFSKVFFFCPTFEYVSVWLSLCQSTSSSLLLNHLPCSGTITVEYIKANHSLSTESFISSFCMIRYQTALVRKCASSHQGLPALAMIHILCLGVVYQFALGKCIYLPYVQLYFWDTCKQSDACKTYRPMGYT